MQTLGKLTDVALDTKDHNAPGQIKIIAVISRPIYTIGFWKVEKVKYCYQRYNFVLQKRKEKIGYILMSTFRRYFTNCTWEKKELCV